MMKYYSLWRRRAKRDPLWSVSPQGGAKYPFYRYFAARYLFEYLVRTDEEARRVWLATPYVSTLRAHLAQRCLDYGGPEEFRKIYPDVADHSFVHKLSWKKPFPLDALT